MINLNFIYSEIFICLAIMILLIIGVFKKNSSYLIYNLSILSLFGCLALILNFPINPEPFEVDKIIPSISMAKNCIQRLEHIFLKEQLEKCRQMLKDAEESFEDNSELITRITEIQYKMNSIKGMQS